MAGCGFTVVFGSLYIYLLLLQDMVNNDVTLNV